MMRSHTHLPVILLLIFASAVIFLVPRLLNRRAPSHALTATSAARDAFPVTVTDSFGQKITVNSRPLRLVSLAPSITEILFAIGAGERVAADTTYCDYPPEAATRKKIGGYLSPNIEAISAVKPDLVFSDDLNGHAMVDHLSALGIPVIVVMPKSLTEVEDAITMIGRAVGETANAGKLVQQMQQRTEAVLAQTRTLPDSQRLRTLFLISLDQNLFSAGPGSYVDDFIRTAGGKNIAGNAASAWPTLSLETVVADDPEIILLLKGHGKVTPLTKQTALAHFRADARWRTITAVKRGQVFVLDDDLVTLPGPRMVDGLEAIAAALHPEKP